MTRANEWKKEAGDVAPVTEQTHKRLPFIEANMMEVTLKHLRNDRIVPTFTKDNEVCISHQGFTESVYEVIKDFYHGETIHSPETRTSYTVRGYIPEAINKRMDRLLEFDKIMYYEGMIFNIEIPNISRNVNGDRLNLCVIGCKSYARDNLSGKITTQRFNLAIGFLNLTCINQCLSADGCKEEIRAVSTRGLYQSTPNLFSQYNVTRHVHLMRSLGDTMLSKHQFCQILGRTRLYNYLPQAQQRELPRLLITDNQINNTARVYIHDDSFAGNNGELSMWRFYNLIIGANKSNYPDTFLGRSVNMTEVLVELTEALSGKDVTHSWFIE